MAKDRSFAAKVAKAAAGGGGRHCPKCGEIITSVKLVTSEKSPVTGAWRFNQKLVKVCKCNKEILG